MHHETLSFEPQSYIIKFDGRVSQAGQYLSNNFQKKNLKHPLSFKSIKIKPLFTTQFQKKLEGTWVDYFNSFQET